MQSNSHWASAWLNSLYFCSYKLFLYKLFHWFIAELIRIFYRPMKLVFKPQLSDIKKPKITAVYVIPCRVYHSHASNLSIKLIRYRWRLKSKYLWLISSRHKIVIDWVLIGTLLYLSGFIIPQRVVLSIMGFLAIVNAYTMRICLNVAITEMVVKIPLSNETDSKNQFCIVEGGESEASLGGGDFDWSESRQGVILGGKVFIKNLHMQKIEADEHWKLKIVF